jgi:GntR family transcriptional regulator / MocR family aminotransferase
VVGYLGAGLDDRAVADAGRELGLNLSPLSKHFRHGGERSGLVLGYAACDEIQMRLGIRKLREAMDRSERAARSSAGGSYAAFAADVRNA